MERKRDREEKHFVDLPTANVFASNGENLTLYPCRCGVKNDVRFTTEKQHDIK